MAGDVSVILDLDAKQLYNELQQVQSHIASLAAHSTEHGTKAGHGFVSSLKNAFSGIGDVFSNVKNAITSTAGLFGVGIGVGVGIAEIKSVIEFGAHIEDLSRKTGVNAETLSRWGFAAQKAGTDIDGLSKFIGFLEINREKAARGDEAKTQQFKNLGVAAEDLKNPLISIDTILAQISKGNINALDLKAVGGKGALEMRELLQAVGDGTIKLDKSLSALDTKKLKDVEDAFTDLKQSITVGLAPAIVQVFRSLEDHADTFVTHIREAVIQVTALHDAAKSKTPGALFDALKKGQDDTAKEEQGLANRQTQREKKRIEEEAESKKPTSSTRFGLISDDADDVAAGKAGKKEAKADAKEEKEAAEREKKNLDDFYAGKKATEKEALGRETADLDEYYAQNPGALTPTQQKDKEQKDQAKDARDSAREANKQNKQSQKDDKFEKNPAGLSLHEMATKGSGNVGAQAREAEREEQLAQQLQLQGNTKQAAEHQTHAEKLKQSLGLPSKEDAKDNIKKGLDESETLKKIEKNTANAGANK